jgi:glutamine---fructose-6-phosphate transaminase (isomerizing)
MCGIIAAVATKNIVPVLLEGLQKLKYRGYDSGGLAVLKFQPTRLRIVGCVYELAAKEVIFFDDQHCTYLSVTVE